MPRHIYLRGVAMPALMLVLMACGDGRLSGLLQRLASALVP
jgi:hypothetical protein